MGHTTAKLRAALAAAEADAGFAAQYPRFRQMKIETLYHSLEARGYKWDTNLQEWIPRNEVTLRGERASAERQSLKDILPGVFLVKIMADPKVIDNVSAELFELAEALGWEIEERPNRANDPESGQWFSRWFKVKRG